MQTVHVNMKGPNCQAIESRVVFCLLWIDACSVVAALHCIARQDRGQRLRPPSTPHADYCWLYIHVVASTCNVGGRELVKRGRW